MIDDYPAIEATSAHSFESDPNPSGESLERRRRASTSVGQKHRTALAGGGRRKARGAATNAGRTTFRRAVPDRMIS